MALNTQLSDATVNAQASALATLCNGGSIKIYSGAQPASADSALSGETLGVTLTLGNPAFAAPVSGLLTANAIAAAVAVASITPTFARVFKSDGVTAVMDVSVGTASANIILGAFTTGTTINVQSFTHDVRNATAGF